MTLTAVEPLEKFMKIEEAVDLEQQTVKRRSRKNQEILIFTCTAFFLFALAEVVGAIASNSLSLLGDAGAMSIDVFTVCKTSDLILYTFAANHVFQSK
jgi:Co/Zn/Cd efflux system component